MSALPSLVNSAFNERWRLPFDVVVDIMAVSQRSTISALMKTCHTLYTEGPKHLLRDGVTLASANETIKFMTFILAEDPSRLKYLRRLALCMKHLVYSEAEEHLQVVRFLFHPFLRLEALILRPAGTFLGRFTDPALHTAIGGLMTVKHLVVVGVDAHVASLITRLPWYLESLSISMTNNVRNILPTFAPFSATLRTLFVKAEPYTPDRFFGANPKSCHFPHVRTFGIVYDESVPGLLASPAFAQAFSTIAHLQLIPSDLPTTRRLGDVPSGSELVHSAGLRAHTYDRRSGSEHTPPALSSLVECSGSLRSVHALHLHGKLSMLRLWWHVRVDELPALHAVLEEACPIRLRLTIELADTKLLFALLRRSAYPEYLDLQILVQGNVVTHLRRILKEVLFHELLPTGLVELNLLLEIPFIPRYSEKSGISDIMAECTRWASSVRFSCRLLDSEGGGEDWQWPDLGMTAQLTDDRLDSNGTTRGLLYRWRMRSETSERSKRWGVLRKLGIRRLG